MTKFKIKKQILLPLVLALTFLLCISIFIVYWGENKEISNNVRIRLDYLDNIFDRSLSSEATQMETLTYIVSNNQELRAAWLARDRAELLNLSLPIFMEFQTKHRITHFYFHEPNRKNYLRVHMPKMHDDIIDRFTMVEAQKTNLHSSGLELGPLGTLSLRTVSPWWINNQLVGYIEMGKEIEHILIKLHDILDLELYISIYKTSLDFNKWEMGMQMLGRKGKWDQLAESVIVSQTLPEIPDVLDKFLVEDHHDYMEMDPDLELSINKRPYRVGVIPLFDAGNREIGDLMALYDASGELIHFRTHILIYSLVCLAIGVMLFSVFYVILGRVEHQLENSRLKLTQESRAREDIQKLHVKEIELEQAKQKKEKEKAQKYLDVAGAIFVVLDYDQTVSLINKLGCEILGYPESEIIGKNWFDTFIPESNKDKAKDVYTQIMKREIEPIEYYEDMIIDRGGKQRVILWHNSMLENDDGKIVAILASGLDITERRLALQALEERENELQEKTISLQETNTALRVLLKNREDDKADLEKKVLSNVNELILPYLNNLKKSELSPQQKTFLNIIESNLNDIISTFSLSLSSRLLKLTPTEIQVANLIRKNNTSKEIAHIMGLSSKTVESHRKSIRKKLRIKNKKTNLMIHLQSIPE